jgi:hypothetical protein
MMGTTLIVSSNHRTFGKLLMMISSEIVKTRIYKILIFVYISSKKGRIFNRWMKKDVNNYFKMKKTCFHKNSLTELTYSTCLLNKKLTL